MEAVDYSRDLALGLWRGRNAQRVIQISDGQVEGSTHQARHALLTWTGRLLIRPLVTAPPRLARNGGCPLPCWTSRGHRAVGIAVQRSQADWTWLQREITDGFPGSGSSRCRS